MFHYVLSCVAICSCIPVNFDCYFWCFGAVLLIGLHIICKESTLNSKAEQQPHTGWLKSFYFHKEIASGFWDAKEILLMIICRKVKQSTLNIIAQKIIFHQDNAPAHIGVLT